MSAKAAAFPLPLRSVFVLRLPQPYNKSFQLPDPKLVSISGAATIEDNVASTCIPSACVCVCHIRSTCSSRQANKWKTIVSEKNFLSEFLIRSDQKVCFFAAIVRCTRTYKIWPPDHCHPHLQAKYTIRNTL